MQNSTRKSNPRPIGKDPHLLLAPPTMAFHKKKFGFTLTEILIVTVIIAALASLALPRFQIFLMKMRNQEAEKILADIFRAQMEYKREVSGAYDTDYVNDAATVFTNALGNLDIAIPVLKNFKNLTLPLNSSQCGSGTLRVVLGSVTANDDSYTLLVRTDGRVVCSCGNTLCQNLGYPAVW